MQLGMVGLGRMGLNMAVRLLRRGHAVVGTAHGTEAFAALEKEGGTPLADLGAVVRALDPPRTVWVMVPAGPPTQSVLDTLRETLQPGDLVVDGGNSRYIGGAGVPRRAQDRLRGRRDQRRRLGLENGYCLMVGQGRRRCPLDAGAARPGPRRRFPAHRARRPGHYCKMIHNGTSTACCRPMARVRDPGQERLRFDLAKVAHLEPGKRRALVAAGAGRAGWARIRV
jgi:6-phosphogluconate dehydrogenase